MGSAAITTSRAAGQTSGASLHIQHSSSPLAGQQGTCVQGTGSARVARTTTTPVGSLAISARCPRTRSKTHRICQQTFAMAIGYAQAATTTTMRARQHAIGVWSQSRADGLQLIDLRRVL